MLMLGWGTLSPVSGDVLPDDYDRSLLSEAWVEVLRSPAGERLTAELQREASPGHVLERTDAVAVLARRFAPDPSLDLPTEVIRVASAYALGKPKLAIYWVPSLAQWAVVHLTWTAENEAPWPSSELASNWMAVVEDVRDRGRG